MSWIYRHCIRTALFTLDSEPAHNLTLNGLAMVARSRIGLAAMESAFGAPSLPTRCWNLDFPNPVGLAAGMDKRAAALPAWKSMGFGFTELGGVTRHPQPGNPEPRMFRHPPLGALLNRMGFNNPGAERMAETLESWRDSGLWPAHPVGMNLGKSKITPLEEAASDYARSFERLWPLADFFVVNVSSPNTPNLRQLQDKASLAEILAELGAVNQRMAASRAVKSGPKPLLVKIAPDLTFEALEEIVALALEMGLSGIVATNTTITRPEAGSADGRRLMAETGGLSGAPLRARSTEVIRHLHRQSQGRLPIVGVGGIFTAEDAWEKITAGATLLQVYTGLVYEGPGIARAIVQGLAERLKANGLASIREAVGIQA